MADPNDKYRNPDAPPQYVNHLESETAPLPQVHHDPNAPFGLYRYELDCNKVYFPQFDYIIDLDVLINSSNENLSDFQIQTSDEEGVIHTSDEESDSSVGIISDRSNETGGQMRSNDVVNQSKNEDNGVGGYLHPSLLSGMKGRQFTLPPVNIPEDNNYSLLAKKLKQQQLEDKKRTTKEQCPDSDTGEGSSQKHRSISNLNYQCQEIDSSRRKRSREQEESDSESIIIESEDFQRSKIIEPDHLFGSYHCNVCNIKLNSELTYVAHINGKKHLKALKVINVADTVLKTFPQVEEGNRCPAPPAGVCRLPVNKKAIIQDVIAENLKTPCPGLHKVKEIQGIAETTYYCTLCDSPCSTNSIISHLSGYKHQFSCLKYFRPDLADRYSQEPKVKIQKSVIAALADVQKQEGRGRVCVEREYYEKDIPREKRKSKKDLYKPSTSSAHPSETEDILDRTKSGFYCKVCEAPMNCALMWENHIRGKRHAANMKKAPGSIPSKLKFVPVINARSVLLERLVEIREPIVGLDHIRETQNHETKSETYQCLLCSACLTHLDIIDHLLLQKHRKKYLQHIKHPDLGLLRCMNYQDPSVNTIIEDICARTEEERGRGHPQVLVSKSKVKQ